jgi:hypothetical protein
MKVVRLSALRIDHFYPSGNIPGTHFCYKLIRPQGHSTTGRIMSMKNFNDTIGNRTRDLPVCSAEPQPTAPTPARLRAVQNHKRNANTKYNCRMLNLVVCKGTAGR